MRKMNEKPKYPYNEYDPQSILTYANQIIGRSLRDTVGVDERYINKKGKGGLGQMVEELFFLYHCNSKPAPDIEEAGVEIKTTPLKLIGKKQNDLVPKERLVCGMIDYMSVYNETFEESSFLFKCNLMLLLFYLHEDDKNVIDLLFQFVTLWTFPEKDLLIIKNDWNTIVSKIKAGKAHEISEGDTMYLGACTKGTVTKNVKQPKSDILARKRAFSLKPCYIKEILAESGFISSGIKSKQIVTVEELRVSSFEDIIKAKFTPFLGMDYRQIFDATQRPSTEAKSKNYYASKAILGVSINQDIDEFVKAEVSMKTIRLSANNKSCEEMSFPNVNYIEIVKEDEWTESQLYDLFTKRFFFVVFKENIEHESAYELIGTFFWTMPPQDLLEAKNFWEETKSKIIEDDFNHFRAIRDKKMFHIRPKAIKKTDLTQAPSGKLVPKKAYWLNKEYFTELIIKEGII